MSLLKQKGAFSRVVREAVYTKQELQTLTCKFSFLYYPFPPFLHPKENCRISFFSLPDPTIARIQAETKKKKGLITYFGGWNACPTCRHNLHEVTYECPETEIKPVILSWQ